jgi:hypothetical protein
VNIRELDRLERKYILTVEAGNTFLSPTMELKQIKAHIADNIDALWQIPNKTFNILRACADAGASAPQNEHEKQAVLGYQFCHHAVQIVDYLKSHRNTLSLGAIRKALIELLDLMRTNIHGGEDSWDKSAEQFPHVAELIFQLLPSSKRYDRKIRDQEYAKARKGLSRMTSIALSMLGEINRLGGTIEEEGRFEPQGAKLSESQVMSFIRQYGDQYSIPDLATWSLVLNVDPSLEPMLIKLVHALERGHVPVNGSEVKKAVQEIVLRHKENNQPTNTLALEQEDAPATPLEFGEKMASKYGD